MRTDGTNTSKDAVEKFRNYIIENYGKNYLPKNPLNYSGKKAKNAQEAHEAIRPTEISRNPEKLKKYLSLDQYKLYNLIWSRAILLISASFSSPDAPSIKSKTNLGRRLRESSLASFMLKIF